jgi:flagellar hook-associated protein 2
MSDSTIFTGSSRYSADFTAIIDRAVAIASLPLNQLQLSKQRLEAESSAIGSLNSKVMAVQTAISNLNSAVGLDSFSTSVSNGAVLSASVGSGAFNGTYTIEVTSLGAYSTAMSKDGLHKVADPAAETISASSNPVYTLNGTTITPASNTLNGLAAAINEAGLDIQATVVNIGSGSAPDYRLALQSTKLGAVAMQLNDGTADLFSSDPPNGFQATYKVNGVDALPSDSRTITLGPGITANLVGEGTATVTVSRSTTAIQNALASFVNAYNGAVSELDKHRGVNGGALAGQGLILSVWESLRSVGQFAGEPGEIGSLADLGLTFDQEGKMSLDTSVFTNATSGKFDQLLSFLGSATGGGFLKAATGILDGLENDTDGVITTAANSINASIAGEGKRISENEDRIEYLRTSLNEQMAAADALIAMLEQQATYISSMFESMRIASESYK